MDENKQGLTIFLSAAVVSALLNAVGLSLAYQHSRRLVSLGAPQVSQSPSLVRPRQEPTPGTVEHEALPPPTATGVLRVHRTQGPLPTREPWSPRWDTWPGMDVAVLPQILAMPILESPSITQVRVQGVTDGRAIVWRLSWQDPTRDDRVDTARFTDAAAIQFPLTAAAPFTMGAPQMKVQILHWKAVWQKDVDEGFVDVQDLHPNYWADLYWFADGPFPYRVPKSFGNPLSHAWFVAFSAGNPLADFHRSNPVEELVAAGFGTLTHQPRSASEGKGLWQEGRWAVVFTRPLKTDDPLDYQFDPRSPGSFAMAVWDGASENVGGRKHWSIWVPFEVEP